MNEELLKIRNEIRNKRYFTNENTKETAKRTTPYYIRLLTRLMITIVITLGVLISIKASNNFKTSFYKYVFNTNISFATIDKYYQSLFGSPIPFKDWFKLKTEPVFNEKLTYSDSSKYKDGVKLMVESGYLVPSQNKGLIIFVGQKDGYGKTIIVQQSNGVEVWYGNLNTISVSLYDYVDSGKVIGDVLDNTLYLVYQKDGEVLNYEDFI